MKTTLLPECERLKFRVMKVGGSLFTMPELKNRLLQWAGAVRAGQCVNVWIAGGGGFVDEVRNWQTLHGLSDESAHRISIGLMSQTAEIFHSLFLDWPLLTDVQQLEKVNSTATPNVVFDCRKWALNDNDLSRSWETTSDTISLRLAHLIGAGQLFLLKSRTPQSRKIADAIKDGLIDKSFMSAHHRGPSPLRVSVTNLKASNGIVKMIW